MKCTQPKDNPPRPARTCQRDAVGTCEVCGGALCLGHAYLGKKNWVCWQCFAGGLGRTKS